MPFWDHELLLVEKVCRNIHVADPDDHFTKEVMQRAAMQMENHIGMLKIA